MYNLNAVLATPEFDGDIDIVYDLNLLDKKELHRIEAALIRALQKLEKLTDDELASGKKMFAGTDPQLVTFTVNITKGDGTDFGGYSFRWPGQTDVAREYLKGMFDGIMEETGNKNKRQVREKGPGKGRARRG